MRLNKYIVFCIVLLQFFIMVMIIDFMRKESDMHQKRMEDAIWVKQYLFSEEILKQPMVSLYHQRDFDKEIYEDAHIPPIYEKKQPNVNKDIDCILTIEKINLQMPVFSSKNNNSYLENYHLVTGNPKMKYGYGNYIICGHSSKIYGQSLNRLDEMKKGDIFAITKDEKEEHYKVYAVYREYKEKSGDFTMQTQEKEVTILSCEKGKKNPRYIIVKAMSSSIK